MTEKRKLAAILVADVVGYSRLAGADEERTLARLRDGVFGSHSTILIKREALSRATMTGEV
jgi:class 3 adenylate cyclase